MSPAVLPIGRKRGRANGAEAAKCPIVPRQRTAYDNNQNASPHPIHHCPLVPTHRSSRCLRLPPPAVRKPKCTPSSGPSRPSVDHGPIIRGLRPIERRPVAPCSCRRTSGHPVGLVHPTRNPACRAPTRGGRYLASCGLPRIPAVSGSDFTLFVWLLFMYHGGVHVEEVEIGGQRRNPSPPPLTCL